jgi:sigma-54 specific flagellar transcriptional regulator A
LERVYVETAADVIGGKAFDEWRQERTQVFPGAWNLDTRQASRAMRSALITPYHGQTRARPLLPDFHEESTPIDVEPSAVQYLENAVDHARQQQYHQPQNRPKELTRERIARAYQRTAGNITQAARSLGVHKATLYRWMKALGLTRAELDSQYKFTTHHEELIKE